MKDRIKQIIENEHMTPARFADSLHIGRAVISHILNGRNNPSLDVVTRILTEMPQINSDWLLSGNGTMYKSQTVENNIFSNESVTSSGQNSQADIFQQDLFSHNYTNPTNASEKYKYHKENELKSAENHIQNTVNEVVKYIEKPQKRIAKIIIYYTDNTYETFNHEK